MLSCLTKNGVMKMKVIFKSLIFFGVIVSNQDKIIGAEQMVTDRVVRPIPTHIVRKHRESSARLLPGQVRTSHRVELSLSISGLLLELNALEGTHLKKGELIAKIDSRDFYSALQIAQAKFDKAKRELKRKQALREELVITQVELDDAQTELDIARAELAIRNKAYNDTLLVAPFDGIVVARYAETHEHVNAKQPLLSFENTSKVEISINIPERIMLGNSVEELSDINVRFDRNDADWIHAEICEYSAIPDPLTNTYRVVAEIQRPNGLNILPGMTVFARINIDPNSLGNASSRSEVYVPVEALWEDSQGDSCVWIISPAGGNPEKRKVIPGSFLGENVGIKRGLSLGEHVALAGIRSLAMDQLVRPSIKGKDGLEG